MCGPEELARIKKEIRGIFESYEFSRAERYLGQIRPPCSGHPLVRLYRILAESGRIFMDEGDIPAADRARLADRILGILRGHPDLPTQEELPGPFAEHGNPVAAPFEQAVKRLNGG